MDYGDTTSFYEQMTEQMNECDLTPRERELMAYLIGSLENDGLLKKKLSTLADELEIYAGIQTTESELEAVLARLQTFDPPGIGARDLRECLCCNSVRMNIAEAGKSSWNMKLSTSCLMNLPINVGTGLPLACI